MASKEIMCDYPEKQQWEVINEPKDAPKHIRCPKCGRRLKPRLHDCHYPYYEPCWHYGLPPHKIKKWWKKKRRV